MLRKMETETPLDVLSRAASLLDRQVMPCNLVGEQDKANVADDLLRGGVKSRRRKRRDNRDYSASKLRQQRRTAATQTSVSLMQEANNPETEEDSMSSGEVAECESNCEDQEEEEEEEENCDSPLDMSIRNRSSTSPSSDLNNKNSSMCSSQFAAEQQRPSVITCTSTLLQQKSKICADGSRSNKKSSDDGVKHGHRREVLSGMCDPVIDEHFRRSLGKDYPEMFSGTHVTNTVTESGLSVDDHFAKALGETWLRLQEKNSTSTTSRPAIQKSSAGALNTQKSIA